MKPTLNKALFWDTDYQDIDYEKHARFVIERVVTRGNLKDWKELSNGKLIILLTPDLVLVRNFNGLLY